MVKMEKMIIPSVGEDVEQQNHHQKKFFYFAGGMWNNIITLESSLTVSHKVKYTLTAYPKILLLGVCLREKKTGLFSF